MEITNQTFFMMFGKVYFITFFMLMLVYKNMDILNYRWG